MANLIFDLMGLNYEMNSMKDSGVLLPVNLKRTNFAFHSSLLIFTDILMVYIYLFCFVLFCIHVFTLVPSL